MLGATISHGRDRDGTRSRDDEGLHLWVAKQKLGREYVETCIHFRAKKQKSQKKQKEPKDPATVPE